MEEKQKLVLEKLFEIDFQKTPLEIIKDLEGEINLESKITVEEEIIEDSKEIAINYQIDNNLNRVMVLSIAAGLPTEEFLKAEYIYRGREKQEDEGNDDKREYKYSLEGSLLCGSLAQYAVIMSEGFIEQCQTRTYNAIGLEKFLRFQGNEFLGLKTGLLYYLNDIYYDQRSMMKEILYSFEDNGLIKHGNISAEYRKHDGQELKEDKIKKVLVDVFQRCLEIGEGEAESLVEEQFDSKIVECKMRFIDRYKLYEKSSKEKEDKIVNYIFTENIPAQLFKQIGSSYLVDKGLKKYSGDLEEELLSRIEEAEGDELDKFKEHSFEVFEPYILLKKDGNGRDAINRLKEKGELNQLTNKLSLDYLQALIKDIILDLNKKDKNILRELFRLSRKGYNSPFLEVIKDRLHYSMKIQQKLPEDERVFKSSYFQEKPELLTEEDKVYPLAQTALEQLSNMYHSEIARLYSWEIKGVGIELVLCPQTEGEQEAEGQAKVIEYHSSDSTLKFNNQEKRLKLDCQEPSSNRIYGSSRQNQYLPDRDIEYLVPEDELYQFNNTQGVGFTIFSPYTSKDKKIKIDGQTINKEYQERDREEANIGHRTKTLRDSYFGQNIILRDKKSFYGEPCGELIYFYGPNKKDELIIEGFQNGDYGIRLREKIRSKEEKTAAVTYTEHQLKIEPFEFAILNKFKISREIYQHSVLEVQGVIKKENAHKYYKYLREQEDPAITVTYDNDERKILFKGIIEEFGLGTEENQTHYLRIKAFSYSKLLERRRKNRVFQNMGTSYQEVFDIIKSQNPEFHIDFADTSVASTPLINEDYPVVIQYKENEWDFIKRLATYLNQILIVDDSKDNQEKINIQAGPHNNVAQEFNNIAGGEGRKTGRKNTKYKYYRVKEHEHYRSDNIFQIGKKINYRLSNKTKETLELIIIKNLIYLKNQRLCSDLTMVKEEDIKLVKEIREKRIEGRSFRGEVVKVNNKYQVKVRFIDLEDDFQEDKAHWFPIDRIYTNAFIAPEIGDIVDIYFKARNEKYASVANTTRDEKRKINHDPADKMIKTPGGYQIRLNNQSVLFAAPKMSSKMELKEREINFESNGSSIKMEDDIRLKADKAAMLIDDDVIQLSFGDNGIKVKDGEINIS